MKCQLLCLLFVAFVATCSGMVFDCVNSNNCDKCPPLPENCQNTTKCGCCYICKDTLKQGESCVMTIVMTTLSQKQCGPDLMCDQDTMKCEPKSIVMSKLFPEDGNKLISQHHYIPDTVRCNGSVCFCVYGREQLHRYELLKQEHIAPYSCSNVFGLNKDFGSKFPEDQRWLKCWDCNTKKEDPVQECAALKEKYQRMKLIGPLIACDKQGYYEKKQCIGSVCHCVNKAGEKIQTETFPVSDFKNYNC